MSDHSSEQISTIMSQIDVGDSSQSSEARNETPSSGSLEDSASNGSSNSDSKSSYGPENLHDSQHLQKSEGELGNTVRIPWLVKPGIHAVEVYERIILSTCREEVSLRPCIGQAAVLATGYQVKDKEGRPWMVGNNGQTRHIGYRDICYVLLTPLHSQHVIWFFESQYCQCYISSSTMTPSGMLNYTTPPERNDTLNFAPFIERLGAYRPHLRSQLPKGVPVFPTYGDQDTNFNNWAMPLAPRKSDPLIKYYSRVEKHDGFTRVEWPIPYEPVVLQVSMLGPACCGNAFNFVENTQIFVEELRRGIRVEELEEQPEDMTTEEPSREERDYFYILRTLDDYRRMLFQAGHIEGPPLGLQREMALMKNELRMKQLLVQKQLDTISVRYSRLKDLELKIDCLFDHFSRRRYTT